VCATLTIIIREESTKGVWQQGAKEKERAA